MALAIRTLARKWRAKWRVTSLWVMSPTAGKGFADPCRDRLEAVLNFRFSGGRFVNVDAPAAEKPADDRPPIRVTVKVQPSAGKPKPADGASPLPQ